MNVYSYLDALDLVLNINHFQLMLGVRLLQVGVYSTADTLGTHLVRAARFERIVQLTQPHGLGLLLLGVQHVALGAVLATDSERVLIRVGIFEVGHQQYIHRQQPLELELVFADRLCIQEHVGEQEELSFLVER